MYIFKKYIYKTEIISDTFCLKIEFFLVVFLFFLPCHFYFIIFFVFKVFNVTSLSLLPPKPFTPKEIQQKKEDFDIYSHYSRKTHEHTPIFFPRYLLIIFFFTWVLRLLLPLVLDLISILILYTYMKKTKQKILLLNPRERLYF